MTNSAMLSRETHEMRSNSDHEEIQARRRAGQEDDRREILERRRAEALPERPFFRLPTKQELAEEALLQHHGDAFDGGSATVERIDFPTYGTQLDRDRLVIDRPKQLVPRGAKVRLVCVYADAFDSIGAVVAWFQRWEPYFRKAFVMLPRYWVVGSKPVGWQELGLLSRIGASYEQLPEGVRDICDWLEKRYPPIEREYTPSSPRLPVEVEPPVDDTSSFASWDHDREEISRAHARGLRRKDEILHRDRDRDKEEDDEDA